MRIDPFVRDLQKFRHDLASALDNAETRLYLDTSTLMWLARLSRAARQDFIGWCSGRNVLVPVWVAHEFQRHLLTGTVKSNMHKIVKETATKQREFAQIATEQADDALCMAKGYGLRDVYISEVQRLMASFQELGRVIEPDDERLKVAAEEVVAFINSRMLNSDLDCIISDLSSTGNFRLKHQVPPGYQDGHKSENFMGDVVVWREILDDMESITRKSQRQWFRFALAKTTALVSGVLISRDQKTDWLSAAPHIRIDENTIVRPDADLELEVDLPHPLLGHEFERRGGGRFFLVHPAALSRVVADMELRANAKSKTAAWRGASLRPDVAAKLEARAAQDAKRKESKAARPKTPAPTPDGTSGALPRGGGTLSPATGPAPADPVMPAHMPAVRVDLTGLDPAQVMKGSVAAEARAYRLADDDERTSLLNGWRQDVVNGTLSASKMGRIICSAGLQEADGLGVAEIPALLDTLRKYIPDHSEAMLLGALCSAYFDEHGEALKRPKAALATVLLCFEQSSWAAPAFTALATFLTKVGASLPYVPGSREKVEVKVDMEKGTSTQPPMLTGVCVGGHDVLDDDVSNEEHPRRLSKMTGVTEDQKCKPGTLLALISREYLVPRELIMPVGLADKDFSWRSDAGLRPMDTSGSGGIGRIEDEDDE